MKNLWYLMIFIPISLFSQTAFSSYEGNKDVTTILINKKMIEMMSEMKMDANDKDMKTYMETIKKIEILKVFTTSNRQIASKMKQDVGTYIQSSKMNEIAKVLSDGIPYKFYTKSNNSSGTPNELVMFVESTSKGHKTVLLWISGEINIENIEILFKKLKLPFGGKFENSKRN